VVVETAAAIVMAAKTAAMATAAAAAGSRDDIKRQLVEQGQAKNRWRESKNNQKIAVPHAFTKN
jgi:hypothetical protein